MTSDSGVPVGESRRLIDASGPDDDTPRPREVAVGAGLGGFVAIVLLVVSAVLSGSGQHEATMVRPGTSGDGPAGAAVTSSDIVGSFGQDARDARDAVPTASASPSARRPPAASANNPRLVAAGATSAVNPVGASAVPADVGPPTGDSAEPGAAPPTGPSVAAPANVPNPAASPSTGQEPTSTGGTAGTAELTRSSESASPASPQPEATPSCPEDSNFAGSLLRALGLASCNS